MPHAVESLPERVPFAGHVDIEAHIDKPSDPETVPQALRGIAVILGPGAGGSRASGHLPTTAQTLAEGGLVCVRYSIKPPNMSLRMKVVQVRCSMLANRYCGREGDTDRTPSFCPAFAKPIEPGLSGLRNGLLRLRPVCRLGVYVQLTGRLATHVARWLARDSRIDYSTSPCIRICYLQKLHSV